MDLSEALIQVLETLAEGVHLVDKNGVTLIYNQAASRLDGLSKDEVIGRHLLEVFPSLDEDSSTLLRVLRSGKAEVAREQTFSNYKGIKITTINSTHPIYINNKLEGACEISLDITKIKEMAERMQDLRKALRDRSMEGDVERSIQHRQSEEMLSGKLFTLDDIVGESSVMKEVKRTALQVSRSNSNVMVFGETGTGKELLVQAIHSASERRDLPFVAQNSAALPENLLEGLMFGTSRGGFTGAQDRPGLLELASGGTLYLDEIDSMPLGLQAKLLRVIQERRVRRLGDLRERPVDVRFISSTSIPPREAVKKGLLRPDLYYRLSVVEIGLPPLRERREDIPLLCDHFLKKHGKNRGKPIKGISPMVMAAFLAYDWPGNVRELEHAIEGSIALSQGEFIELEHLPPSVKGVLLAKSVFLGETTSHTQSAASFTREIPNLRDTVRNQEKETIEKALKEAKTISGAARALGIPRQTLQYKMKVLGIKKD